MKDYSRNATIAKYTNKSRYKPEYIYGKVYIDEDRIAEALKSKDEKEIFKKEFRASKRFSDCFSYDVFMLPQKETTTANSILFLGHSLDQSR